VSQSLKKRDRKRMNYLDTYYRALLDYRKITAKDRDCTTQRNTVAKANAKADEVIITKQICDIKTDWIEEIEQGLVHVDKAIREDRQFIRSNGEVVDIEKVKNVSRESVEHLAKHSNLIEEFNEGEEVIPKRLYTVERLSDYAVYENRFLYMLLCYLRDFITVRYNKILDLEHTYHGQLLMDKQVVMPKRKLNIKLSLNEEKKDDCYLKAKSKSRDVIRRISDILELTHAFLATPLMQEVSKVAMLKPPITKTNVLRMNHNFRGALALYEYVTAYEGDGYTVRDEVQKINPFKIDMADEFAEIALLSSFLTYEYGLDIKDELKEEYDKEEEIRKQEEAKRHLEQLKALRRRIKEAGESPEEYMLGLEKVNKVLEQNTIKLEQATKEIEGLNAELAELRNQTRLLGGRIGELLNEIEGIKDEHGKAIKALGEEYDAKIEQINEEHSDELQKIITECDERVDEIKCKIEQERLRYETALENAKIDHERRIELINSENEARTSELKQVLEKESEQMRLTCQGYAARINELESEREKVENERRLAEARLIAIRREHGLSTPAIDYTTETAFEELEHQLDVFETFFFAEWTNAKKAIRQNVIKDFFKLIKMAKKRRKTPEGRAEIQAKINENKAKKDKNQPQGEQNPQMPPPPMPQGENNDINTPNKRN